MMRLTATACVFVALGGSAEGQELTLGEALRQVTLEHLPEHARGKDNWPLLLEATEKSFAIYDELKEQADAHPDWLFLDFTWDLHDLSDWEEEDQLGELSDEIVEGLQEAAPEGVFESMLRPLAPREEFQRLADEGLARMEKEGVFDALALLADHPYGVGEAREGSIESFPLPELGGTRMVTRALAYRGRLAIARGDDEAAVDCFRQILALSQILSYQPLVLHRLVALGLESSAIRLAERAVLERVGVQSMFDILKQMDGWPSLSLHMEGEGVYIHAEVSMMIEELRANGETFEQPDPDIEELAAELVEHATGRPARAMATPEQLHAGVDRLISEYVDAFEMPRDKRKIRMDEIEASFDNDRRLSQLAMYCSMFSSTVAQDMRGVVYRNGGKTMLAIEAYRAEHGRNPDSLDELTPGILDSLPPDPFAPDGQFRYLRHRDGEGTYLLYSVGRDGVDNQGRLRDDSRYARWDSLLRLDLEVDFVFGIVD